MISQKACIRITSAIGNDQGDFLEARKAPARDEAPPMFALFSMIGLVTSNGKAHLAIRF
jgi:hypothetical protein